MKRCFPQETEDERFISPGSRLFRLQVHCAPRLLNYSVRFMVIEMFSSIKDFRPLKHLNKMYGESAAPHPTRPVPAAASIAIQSLHVRSPRPMPISTSVIVTAFFNRDFIPYGHSSHWLGAFYKLSIILNRT